MELAPIVYFFSFHVFLLFLLFFAWEHLFSFLLLLRDVWKKRWRSWHGCTVLWRRMEYVSQSFCDQALRKSGIEGRGFIPCVCFGSLPGMMRDHSLVKRLLQILHIEKGEACVHADFPAVFTWHIFVFSPQKASVRSRCIPSRLMTDEGNIKVLYFVVEKVDAIDGSSRGSYGR